MKEDCLFCDIYKDKKGIIYENNYFYAQFDIYPVSPGYAEVIPKRHVTFLNDLTVEEWKYLKPAISDVMKIIQKTNFEELYTKMTGNPVNDKSQIECRKMFSNPGIINIPDAFNVGINDGEVAGRTIHHLHVHIIPRYLGDVDDPISGVRNVIPSKGNYRK